MAHVAGWFHVPSRTAAWGYAGLYALVLGALLVMFNPAGAAVDTRVSMDRAGYAMTTAAVGCFAVGELTRRRSRTPAVIELRGSRAKAATPASVAALQKAAHNGESWLVSQSALAEETLAAAAQAGVRCYVEGANGFEEQVSTGLDCSPVHKATG